MGNVNVTVHNESVLESLNVGDLVQFPRVVFSHWAVYLGNGEVMHLAGVGNSVSGASVSASSFSIGGDRFDKAEVCIDKFRNVAKGSMAYRNNNKDKKWRPLSAEEIVEKAKSKRGDVGYNVITANCENFANWCRYGISQSDQADRAVIGAVIVLTGALVLGSYVIDRVIKMNKNKKKKVATKR